MAVTIEQKKQEGEISSIRSREANFRRAFTMQKFPSSRKTETPMGGRSIDPVESHSHVPL
jgi:hypothetical protein